MLLSCVSFANLIKHDSNTCIQDVDENSGAGQSWWYATASLFQMDINPFVDVLWAQWFSNKSTQLSTFAPAKCPAKALLSVALPNSLISAVGCGLAHLSSLLLPRCSRLNYWSQFPPSLHSHPCHSLMSGVQCTPFILILVIWFALVNGMWMKAMVFQFQA